MPGCGECESGLAEPSGVDAAGPRVTPAAARAALLGGRRCSTCSCVHRAREVIWLVLPRYVPSQADIAVFEAIAAPPPAELFHALRWYNHIKSYEKQKARYGKTQKLQCFPELAYKLLHSFLGV